MKTIPELARLKKRFKPVKREESTGRRSHKASTLEQGGMTLKTALTLLSSTQS